MSKSFALAIALILPMCAEAQSSGSTWQPGEYKLVSGNPSSGSLVIRSVASGAAEFSLQAFLCTSDCRNPEVATHRIGEVEQGTIKLSGLAGKYMSENAEDKELGTCILHFRVKRTDITIRQAGTCWWFGVGVDVSGLYRLSRGKK